MHFFVAILFSAFNTGNAQRARGKDERMGGEGGAPQARILAAENPGEMRRVLRRCEHRPRLRSNCGSCLRGCRVLCVRGSTQSMRPDRRGSHGRLRLPPIAPLTAQPAARPVAAGHNAERCVKRQTGRDCDYVLLWPVTRMRRAPSGACTHRRTLPPMCCLQASVCSAADLLFLVLGLLNVE